MTKEFSPNPYQAEQESPDVFYPYYGDLNDKDSLAYDIDPVTGKQWIDIVFEVERNAKGEIITAKKIDPDADRRFIVTRQRIGRAKADKVINNALDNLANGPRNLRRQPKNEAVLPESDGFEDFIGYIGEYFRDPDSRWLNSQVKWNLEKFGENKKGEKVFKYSMYLENNRGKKGGGKTVITGTRKEIIDALDKEFGFHEPHLRVVGDED